MRIGRKIICTVLLLLTMLLPGCGQYDVLDRVAELSTDAVQTETVAMTETVFQETGDTGSPETAESENETETPGVFFETESDADNVTETESGTEGSASTD